MSAYDLDSRFWAKIAVDANGCWLWKGAMFRSGYGHIVRKIGQLRRDFGAHHFAFLAVRGEVPPGLELDHLCRVRQCCNPGHLEPVTRAENIRRGLGHPNRRKTHCPSGHEYTPENTRLYNGKRYCCVCHGYGQVAA